MNKSVVLLCAGILAGCGFHENPMQDQPDIFKHAIPGSTGDQAPKAHSSDLISIIGPGAFSFIEGKSDKMEFVAKLNGDGLVITGLVAVNISDFPGAQFDGSTGVFEWAPPAGTTADDVQKVFQLTIRAFAKSTTLPNGDYISRDLTVLVAVQKNPADPQVVSVDFPTFSNSKLREGDVYHFTVTAKDPDAGSDPNKGPMIVFLPSPSEKISLGDYVHYISMSGDVATHTYVYTYELNLTGVELTDSSQSVGFSVQAISRFGHRSAAVPWADRIYTNLWAPQATWTATKNIRFNEENSVEVLVYDSKGEGILSLDRVTGLPADASFDCPQRMATGAMECVFKWKPTGDPKTLPISGSFSLIVTSSNRDPQDSGYIRRSTLSLSYQVTTGSP
jgi:hypothetical protein